MFASVAVMLAAAGLAWHSAYVIVLSASLASYLVFAHISFIRSVNRADVSAERILSTRKTSIGSEITCLVNVFLPGGVIAEAEDLLSDAFELRGKNTGTGVGSITLSYSITPLIRGVFPVGPVRIKIKDPPGLFYAYRTAGVGDEVVIFPSIKEVKKFDLASKRKVSELIYGLRRSWHKGYGTEFLGLREYIPGDDPRSIDWKASARHRKLFTRECEAERRQRVIIAIDAGRSMYCGQLKNTMLDKAVETAILLSHIILKNGDLAGLAIYSDTLKSYIPPGSGKKQFTRILESLAAIDPDKETNYEESFRRIVAHTKKRAFIILITDLSSEYEEIKKALKLAAAGKHKVLIIQTFPPKFERFQDETAQMIAEAAEERYVEKLSRMKSDLIRYGVHIVPVGPDTIIPTTLAKYTAYMEHGMGAR